MSFIIGSLGFLLFFIYDCNTVKWKKIFLRSFFAIGFVLVLGATVSAFLFEGSTRNLNLGPRLICSLVFAIIFLGLLIKTLFFSFPFDETYVKESSLRKAYMEKLYALCRHPGVLMFAGFFLSLVGMKWEIRFGSFAVWMIILNLLYAYYQDRFIFPETFYNYPEYQRSTPFLLPTGKSIRLCVKQFLEGR